MDEGTVIDGFTVRGELGAGDFATTHLVERDGGRFAMKLAHSVKAVPRAKVEAEALRALDHRGIPKVVAEGTRDGLPYIVMSYAEGRTIKDDLAQRMARGLHFGEIETLEVIAEMMAIVDHMGERGWVHRDIKAANVIVRPTDLRPTLIDFGFAKKHGEVDVRLDNSFWMAGAGVYSPPAKLKHPSDSNAGHDVFAVGVLAFQMLTGFTPWSAGTGDREALLLAMEHPHLTIESIQSQVSPDVVALIDRMLELRDEHRISATDAASAARDLAKSIRPRLPGNGPVRGPIKFTRVVRDPLYGDIRLTENEWEVLNTREMQRLRSIRQLGFANFVYPGAEHSRLSHSLGTLFRVEQILRSIEEIDGSRQPNELRVAARLHGLVHDVTHVAFGHTIEDELGLLESHDHNTARIERLVLDPESELGTALKGSEVGSQVRSLFDPQSTITLKGIVADLVSGPTGADVLDYIDRDALFCGLDHRVDSAILRQLRIDRVPSGQAAGVFSTLYSRLGERTDRAYAVDSLFRERYAMFLKVYTHPAKLAAAAILDKALSLAMWPAKGSKRLTEPELEWMADDALIFRLAQTRGKVGVLGEKIRRRELPRGVYRGYPLEDPDSDLNIRREELREAGLLDRESRRSVEVDLATEARLSPDDVYLYLAPSPPGYKKLEHRRRITSDGTSSPARSPGADAVLRAHQRLWQIWVFLSRDVSDKEAVARLAYAAERRFGFPNAVDVPRLDDRLF